MFLLKLRKLISSPVKGYRSETFILALITVLSIPGIINLIWFSYSFKQELLNDFEKRAYNTHQSFALLYQNQNLLTDKKILDLIRFKDISNLFIFQNDSIVFVLNKNSKKLSKQSLDSLWILGFVIKNPVYVKKTFIYDNDQRIHIFSVFDLTNLKSRLKSFNQQIWLKAGFIFLIFIVLFLLVTFTLLKPIRNLSSEINTIAESNWQAKLTANYVFPEINNIVNAINEFIDKSESKEKKVIEEIQGLIDYLSSRNEELEYAKNNAEDANKYKTEFLANTSHEIRTPLNAILGFAEQLLSSETDETKRYYLNVIKNSGRTLISLVNDILDISKIESGRLEISNSPTNFASLVREISDLYSSKALSKGLAFVIDNDPNIPEEMMLDDLRMRQIFINLISNALKFTDSGSITLSTKLLKFKPIEGKVNILISVKDTGIGVNNEYKKLIFEPFTQQRGQSFRKYGGTGLGLPITKRLVEMMGGRVELESEEGVGSEFKVYLYDLDLVNKNAKNLDENYIHFEFDLARILLFDVNENDRNLLADSIENKKLVIFHANNFEDFEKYCEYEKLDLIIYCCLGNENKRDQIVYKILEIAQNKKIPIFGISNEVTEIIQSPDNKHHFTEIINKPVHIPLLFNKIAKILNPIEKNSDKSEIVDEFGTLWNTFIEKANPIIINNIRENFSKRAQELSNKLVLSHIKEFTIDFSNFTKNTSNEDLNKVDKTIQDNLSKFQLNNIKKILNLISKI